MSIISYVNMDGGFLNHIYAVARFMHFELFDQYTEQARYFHILQYQVLYFMCLHFKTKHCSGQNSPRAKRKYTGPMPKKFCPQDALCAIPPLNGSLSIRKMKKLISATKIIAGLALLVQNFPRGTYCH